MIQEKYMFRGKRVNSEDMQKEVRHELLLAGRSVLTLGDKIDEYYEGLKDHIDNYILSVPVFRAIYAPVITENMIMARMESEAQELYLEDVMKTRSPEKLIASVEIIIESLVLTEVLVDDIVGIGLDTIIEKGTVDSIVSCFSSIYSFKDMCDIYTTYIADYLELNEHLEYNRVKDIAAEAAEALNNAKDDDCFE